MSNYFTVMRLSNLSTCLVSQPLPIAPLPSSDESHSITAIIPHSSDTFVSSGSSIFIYRRVKVVKAIELGDRHHHHRSPILGMTLVGTVLIAFTSSSLFILLLKQHEILHEISLLLAEKQATITCLMHPSIYVNKVVVGCSNGTLQLWNIVKASLIYDFTCHLPFLSSSSSSSSSSTAVSVTCMEQSPAINIAAIGFSSGLILLINLKLDNVLFSFSQDEGQVTSLSFRQDALAEKFPYLASSSADGRVHIWNLGNGVEEEESRKLAETLDDAHEERVLRVQFLHGEPLLLTSAADNSIKVWIFDHPNGTSRLLKSREGHKGHPTRIRYLGGEVNASIRESADATSCALLSAGSDASLRFFNTVVETQNMEMSQKTMLVKSGLRRRQERLPPVVDFASCETRRRDWGDVVTIHRNSCLAYVWRSTHKAITDIVLKQSHWQLNAMNTLIDKRNYCTSIALSPCGNFAVIGHKGGAVYRYNVQSGLSQGSYPYSSEGGLSEAERLEREKTPGNVLFEEKLLLSEGKEGQSLLSRLSEEEKKRRESAEKEAQEQLRKRNRRHHGDVTGLFVDISSSTLLSCGLGNLLFFHSFSSLTLHFSTLRPSFPLHASVFAYIFM